MSETRLNTDGKFFSDEDRNKLIKAEKNKLRKIVKLIDDESLEKVLIPLIERMAFTIVTMNELEKIIMRDGFYEEYQNGENQFGFKENIAHKMYISAGKNYALFLEKFKEYIPVGTKADDEVERFKKEHALQ